MKGTFLQSSEDKLKSFGFKLLCKKHQHVHYQKICRMLISIFFVFPCRKLSLFYTISQIIQVSQECGYLAISFLMMMASNLTRKKRIWVVITFPFHIFMSTFVSQILSNTGLESYHKQSFSSPSLFYLFLSFIFHQKCSIRSCCMLQ